MKFLNDGNYKRMSVPYDPPTRPVYTEQPVGVPLRSEQDDKPRPEDPKRHPLTYLALALSVLALVLSIIALSTKHDNGGDTRSVRDGNRDCVTVPADGDHNGPDGLYCRTGAPTN